jgi:hypothetical protein
MKLLTPIAFVFLATTAQAQTHRCADDAIAKATLLLRFHSNVEPDEAVDVVRNVKALAPIKSLRGNGRFDVLEVWGHYIKATYRMRLIYAQIKGSCTLMGQEILEADNPY